MSLLSTKLLSTIVQNHLYINRILAESVKTAQIRNYAARKGTRERKAKKTKKAKTEEVKKVGFVPYNQRDKAKQLAKKESLKFDDSWKRDPVDDVFVAKYYKWMVYPFTEAVECHKETHSPEMYNQPDAELLVTVELNMQGEKKTRFVENFNRVVRIPHKFDHGEERSIIVFSKNPEEQKEALDAGATLAGGADLIKRVLNGQVNLQDFKHSIAHPNILAELVALRGLMKRRFPNPKSGTLDVNLAAVVDKFMNGINYTAIKDEHEKDFGTIKTPIGTLNMDTKHLEENFAALIQDIYQVKPKRPGSFITRCLITSPPSREVLKVNHTVYLPQETSKTTKKPVKEDEEEEEEEEEEEVGERVAL